MLYNQNNLNIAKIASKEPYKQQLHNILFTKNKTIAADNYRLIEISVPNEDIDNFPEIDGIKPIKKFRPFVIPAEIIKKIKLIKNKNLPITENIAIKSITKNKVNFLNTDLENTNIISSPKKENNFPAYKNIFPTEKPKASIKLNAKYLRELLTIIEKINPKNDITIKLYGKNKPLLIKAEGNNQKARALLMPL